MANSDLLASRVRNYDIQQAINFRIHEEFERLGVEFAYPTQKLWLARVPAGARPSREGPPSESRIPGPQ